MSEQEKKMPEAEERQQESKRYLVFYVIALFSVALVLILLSFLTQVKADKELAHLGVQLQEQTSVVQGAQARMAALQQQVTEQSNQLSLLQKDLDAEKVRGDLYEKKYEATALLLDAQIAVEASDLEQGKAYLQKLKTTYDATQLDGVGTDDLLTATQAALYQTLLQTVFAEGEVAAQPSVSEQ